MSACGICNGSGRIARIDVHVGDDGEEYVNATSEPCEACNGTGQR